MSGKHRIKRHDLVNSLFFLFSQEYDSRKDESILDIRISVEQVLEYLQERFSVSYTGNQWIFTQIRNYEEEIGYRLFEKSKDDDNSYSLMLYSKMEAFEQKRHLYVSQKIKVSNGLFDMISNAGAGMPGQRANILLGAGSTVYHFARILVEKEAEVPFPLDIYSHNMSVINCFLAAHVNHDHLKVHLPGGDLNAVTNSIISTEATDYLGINFDYIVQGASYIVNGAAYVEIPSESVMKKKIMSECRGEKILILTGHEVRPTLPVETEPFAQLSDFNTLIIPHNNNKVLKNLDQMLVDYKEILTPEILNWNYRIYRISSSH